MPNAFDIAYADTEEQAPSYFDQKPDAVDTAVQSEAKQLVSNANPFDVAELQDIAPTVKTPVEQQRFRRLTLNKLTPKIPVASVGEDVAAAAGSPFATLGREAAGLSTDVVRQIVHPEDSATDEGGLFKNFMASVMTPPDKPLPIEEELSHEKGVVAGIKRGLVGTAKLAGEMTGVALTGGAGAPELLATPLVFGGSTYAQTREIQPAVFSAALGLAFPMVDRVAGEFAGNTTAKLLRSGKITDTQAKAIEVGIKAGAMQATMQALAIPQYAEHPEKWAEIFAENATQGVVFHANDAIKSVGAKPLGREVMSKDYAKFVTGVSDGLRDLMVNGVRQESAPSAAGESNPAPVTKAEPTKKPPAVSGAIKILRARGADDDVAQAVAAAVGEKRPDETGEDYRDRVSSVHDEMGFEVPKEARLPYLALDAIREAAIREGDSPAQAQQRVDLAKQSNDDALAKVREKNAQIAKNLQQVREARNANQIQSPMAEVRGQPETATATPPIPEGAPGQVLQPAGEVKTEATSPTASPSPSGARATSLDDFDFSRAAYRKKDTGEVFVSSGPAEGHNRFAERLGIDQSKLKRQSPEDGIGPWDIEGYEQGLVDLNGNFWTIPELDALGLQPEVAKEEAPVEPQALSFKTAKGSTYQVTPEGRTIRTKAARPEHPGDSGLKEPSKKTVYVTQKVAQDVLDHKNLMHEEGDGAIVTDSAGNPVFGIYQSGPRKGDPIKWVSTKPIPHETQPQVGLVPVEFFGNETSTDSFHVGNPIVEVSGPKAALPPLPSRDVPIKVQRADGTSYDAGFNGWQPIYLRDSKTGEPKISQYAPMLSKLKPGEDTWSTGATLEAGEKIVGEIPPKPAIPTPDVTPPVTEEKPTITSIADVAKFPIVETPLAGLTLSADVPNFKAGADPKTGVVEGQALSGKYERLGTGPIVVWERKDGSREVVTGRHRFNLAQQSGEKTIPAQVVREADGFTREMAAALDAESNIRDGQGSVRDYANFFRNTKLERDKAQTRGLLSRVKGRSGYSLGRNASDDLYALYADGKIPEASALAIAEAAPNNAEAQRYGIRIALEGEKPAVISEAVKSRLNDSAGQYKAEAKKVAQAKQDLTDQITGRRALLRKYEQTTGTGSIVAQREKVEAELKAAQSELERWDRWREHPDLKAKVRGEKAPVAEPTSVPKLRPGEKGTGDLLQDDAPFNLAGETAVDLERIAKEKADKEAAAKANEEFQKKNQLELGSNPEPKYRVGNNPTLHTLVERLPQSEAEKANNEQPVRVRNDKTGEVSTVMESDLTPVKERTEPKGEKRDLDAELRALKLDPSVFPDAASKREAIKRAKAVQTNIRGENDDSISRNPDEPRSPGDSTSKIDVLEDGLQRSGEVLRGTLPEITKAFFGADLPDNRNRQPESSRLDLPKVGRTVHSGPKASTESVPKPTRIYIETMPGSDGTRVRANADILAHGLLFGTDKFPASDFAFRLLNKLPGLRVVFRNFDEKSESAVHAQYKLATKNNPDFIDVNLRQLKNYDLGSENSLRTWQSVLNEELLHAATFRLTTKDELVAVWRSLNEGEQQRVISAYESGAQGEQNLGAEYIRMILQERLTGETTEQRSLANLTPEAKSTLQKIVDWLKDVFGSKPENDVARQVIERIEGAIRGDEPIQSGGAFSDGDLIASGIREPERTSERDLYTQVMGLPMGARKYRQAMAPITSQIRALFFDSTQPVTPENTARVRELLEQLTDPTQREVTAKEIQSVLGDNRDAGLMLYRNELTDYALKVVAAGDRTLADQVIQNWGKLPLVGEAHAGLSASARGMRAVQESGAYDFFSRVALQRKESGEAARAAMGIGPELWNTLATRLQELRIDPTRTEGDLESVKVGDRTIGDIIYEAPTGEKITVDEMLLKVADAIGMDRNVMTRLGGLITEATQTGLGVKLNKVNESEAARVMEALQKQFPALAGWRDLLTKKGTKSIANSFWKMMAGPREREPSLPLFEKVVSSELSRLLRQAMAEAGFEAPKNPTQSTAERIVQFLGDDPLRSDKLKLIDERVRADIATRPPEVADQLTDLWDNVMGTMRDASASDVMVKRVVRETMKELDPDWKDVTSKPAERDRLTARVIAEVGAKLRRAEKQREPDIEGNRPEPLDLTEFNALLTKTVNEVIGVRVNRRAASKAMKEVLDRRKIPTAQAEAELEKFETDQTEWLKPDGKRNQVKELIREWLKPDPRKPQIKADYRTALAARLREIGVEGENDLPRRLANEVWDRKQALDAAARQRAMEAEAKNIGVAAERAAQAYANRLEMTEMPGKRPPNEVVKIIRDFLAGDPTKGEPPLSDALTYEPLRDQLIAAGVRPETAGRVSFDVYQDRAKRWDTAQRRAMEVAAQRGSIRNLIDQIQQSPYLAQKSKAWRVETATNWFMSSGLSRDRAVEAAEAFNTEFEKKMVEAGETLATRLLETVPEARRITDIVRGIRSGLLDPDRTWSDAIATREGWKPLSPEQFKQLAELDLKSTDESLSPQEKSSIEEQMMDILRRAGPDKPDGTYARRINEGFVASLLSGVRTFAVQWAPAVMAIRDLAHISVSDPRNTLNYLTAMKNAVVETFWPEMKFAWQKDAYSYHLEAIDRQHKELKRWWESLAEQYKKTENPAKKAWIRVRQAYAIQQFVSRMLSTMDQTMMASAREWKLPYYASTALKQAGLSTGKISSLMDAMTVARQAEFEKGLEAGLDRTTAKVRANSRMDAVVWDFVRNETGSDSLANQTLRAAETDLYSMVGRRAEGLKEGDEGMVSSIVNDAMSAISTMRGKGGFTSLGTVAVTGFVNVPFRTLRFFSGYSPYGLLRYGIYRYRTNHNLENYWKQTFANEIQSRARLREAIAGTAAMALMGLWGAFHNTSDDDAGKEKAGIYITGSGPANKVLRDAWAKQGWKPYSLHFIIAGRKVAIPLTRTGESLMFPAMLAAWEDDLAWKRKEFAAAGKQPPTVSRTALSIIGTAAGMMGQKGALQTLDTIQQVVQGTTDPTKAFVKLISGTGSAAILPFKQTLASISEMAFGPMDQSSASAIVAANFPIVGLPWQEKAVNRFGDELYDRTWYGRISRTGVPFAFQVSKTPENETLYKTLVEKGAAPPELRRYIVEEKFGPMTDAEFAKYAKTNGQILKAQVMENIGEIKNATPDEAKKILSKASNTAEKETQETLGLVRDVPERKAAASSGSSGAGGLTPTRQGSGGLGRLGGLGARPTRSRIGVKRVASHRIGRSRTRRLSLSRSRLRSGRTSRLARLSRPRRPRLRLYA